MFALGFATWSDGDRLAPALHRHLGHTLSSAPEVGGLLVVNPYRSLAGYLLHRRYRSFGDGLRAEGGHESIYQPLRLRRSESIHPSVVRRDYRRLDRRLSRRARRLELDRPALITSDPFLAAFAALRWSGPVTYYAIDDWACHYDFRSWHSLLEEAYADMRRRRVAVCAVSPKILDRIAPTGPSSVMPNGIAANHWLDPEPSPSWLTRLPSPRLLYVGSLDRRLEVARLDELARSFAGGSVILVGPVVEPHLFARLRSLPNVHFREAMPAAAIPAVVHGADVGLVPHVDSPLTRAMSPMKLYEYLAGGLPVVAADLPGVRDVDPRVHLVPRAASFTPGVEAALRKGRSPEADRRGTVERHSWPFRHRTLLELALRGA